MRWWLLVGLCACGGGEYEGEYGEALDIEGHAYRTVLIGDQRWMVDNLRVTSFAQGDPVEVAASAVEWVRAEGAATSWVDNDDAARQVLGNLYNWAAVSDARGLCPEGWRVPTDEDWYALEAFLGVPEEDLNLGDAFRGWGPGLQLKSTTTWIEGGNGSNQSGFEGYPGGLRNLSGGYEGRGRQGYWWTASRSLPSNPIHRVLDFRNDGPQGRAVGRFSDVDSGYALSVRCLEE